MSVTSVSTLTQSQILRPQVQDIKPPVVQTTTQTVTPVSTTRVSTRGGNVDTTA